MSESEDGLPLFPPLDELFSDSELLDSEPEDDEEEDEDELEFELDESDDEGASYEKIITQKTIIKNYSVYLIITNNNKYYGKKNSL